MATVTTGLAKFALPGAAVRSENASFYRRLGKRLFDIAASFLGLVVSSPVLIVCALIVRLTSRGPILFRQIRIGYLGRPFTLVKFRTMVAGAETLGSSVVVIRDPRLTPVGSFLRRTKLDELPQLINVLRGEMSFVGPRPRVPNEVDNDDPRERLLQRVRPGVTSYASIHHRMEADYCARQANPQAVYRSSLLPQKRSLDCEYVNNLTLRLDLKLLFLTFVLVCFPGKPQDLWTEPIRAGRACLTAGTHSCFWTGSHTWRRRGWPIPFGMKRASSNSIAGRCGVISLLFRPFGWWRTAAWVFTI